MVLVDVRKKPAAVRERADVADSVGGQGNRRAVHPVKLRPNRLVEVEKDQNGAILGRVGVSGGHGLRRRGGGRGIDRVHDEWGGH